MKTSAIFLLLENLGSARIILIIICYYFSFSEQWIDMFQFKIVSPKKKLSCFLRSVSLNNLLQAPHESRCMEDAKSFNNKISTLIVKRCYSRRLILQFLSINHMLCYAYPALAAPIMPDMNEPEVIRFVCLFLFIYIFLFCELKRFSALRYVIFIFYVKHLGLWS